jgi:hypothetical protein
MRRAIAKIRGYDATHKCLINYGIVLGCKNEHVCARSEVGERVNSC